MSGVSAKVQGGGSIESVEINVDSASITEGDMLFALQRQRSAILQRTERGVDVDGAPFAAYKNDRPYYWYPAGKVGKKREADALRKEKNNVKRAAKTVNGKVSRSGLGVRFPSYEEFKRTHLGRGTVDLRGPRAPHMLQEIVTKTGSVELSAKQSTQAGLYDNLVPAKQGSIGIYGDASARASGHNSDNRPKGMPKRRFLGASAEDIKRFVGDLESRAAERARKALERK
jgi:hypothetical protein